MTCTGRINSAENGSHRDVFMTCIGRINSAENGTTNKGINGYVSVNKAS